MNIVWTFIMLWKIYGKFFNMFNPQAVSLCVLTVDLNVSVNFWHPGNTVWPQIVTHASIFTLLPSLSTRAHFTWRLLFRTPEFESWATKRQRPILLFTIAISEKILPSRLRKFERLNFFHLIRCASIFWFQVVSAVSNLPFSIIL